MTRCIAANPEMALDLMLDVGRCQYRGIGAHIFFVAAAKSPAFPPGFPALV
jgi:hypothetical protein